MRCVLALLLLASPAFAQSPAPLPRCAQHREFAAMLLDRYKETPVASGIVSAGGMVEVYASKRGTWTVLATNVEGMSCIVAGGNSWSMDAWPIPERA